MTESVAPSQAVGLSDAEADPDALPVVDMESIAVKVVVPLLSGVALIDGLVRMLAQAELVAEADRVRAPTDAEAQREGERVVVLDSMVVREPEPSAERDKDGDPD